MGNGREKGSVGGVREPFMSQRARKDRLRTRVNLRQQELWKTLSGTEFHFPSPIGTTFETN